MLLLFIYLFLLNYSVGCFLSLKDSLSSQVENAYVKYGGYNLNE